MNRLDLTPDSAQKRLWFILLVLTTSAILLLFLIPLTASRTVQTGSVFAYFAAVWLMIAGGVAFWIPLYFKSLSYEIDSDELRVARGVIWKQRVTVTYPKITNVDVSRGPLERLFGIGRVKVQTAGYGGRRGRRPEQLLLGLRNPDEIRTEIMLRIRQADTSHAQQGSASTPGSDVELLTAIQQELKGIRALMEEFVSRER